jgi:hypothetical protein
MEPSTARGTCERNLLGFVILSRVVSCIDVVPLGDEEQRANGPCALLVNQAQTSIIIIMGQENNPPGRRSKVDNVSFVETRSLNLTIFRPIFSLPSRSQSKTASQANHYAYIIAIVQRCSGAKTEHPLLGQAYPQSVLFLAHSQYIKSLTTASCIPFSRSNCFWHSPDVLM